MRKVYLILAVTLCGGCGYSWPIRGVTALEVRDEVNYVSVSLTGSSIFYGVVGSQNQGQCIVEGSVDFSIRLSPIENRAYLEVLTDGRAEVSPGITQVLPVKGHRFEIDVPGTIALADNRIRLLPNGPYRADTVSPVPDLSGARFVIREYVTIGDVFGRLGNLLLHGTGMSSTSDRIAFYDNASRDFVTYWFRKNASGTIAQWRSLDPADATDYTNRPIPPGVGVMLYRQPSAGPVTLHHVGHLRETPFRLPLPAGYSLVSHSRPLDHSPAMARMFQGSGWVGSSTSDTSDEIQVWNGESKARFWFRSEDGGGVQQWRSSILTDTRDRMYDPELIHGDRAIFIRKRTADLDYLMDLQPGGAPAPSP